MYYVKTLTAMATAVLVLLGVHACKKDNQAPRLTIERPFTNQAISASDSVQISGTISDDKDLHELYITVTNAQGDTAMHKSPYVHGFVTHNYSVYFAPTDTGTYTATVTIIDHDLDYTQQSVTFSAHNAPSLNLVLPIDSQAVPVNSSMQVRGTASDDKGLLYISMVSTRVRSGDTVNNHTLILNNATSYSFDEFLTQTDTGVLNITVTAVNHYSFPTSKTIRYIVY